MPSLRIKRSPTVQKLCALLVLWLLVSRCAAVAQVFVGPATEDPGDKKYTVDGIVVDAVTGEPISRALVTAQTFTVMTGTDGSFELKDLPPFPTFVQVRKPGFFNGQEIHPGSSSGLQFVNLAEVKGPVVLKLTPQAVITGHITDPNGEPLENVPVAISSTVIENGWKQQRSVGSATTDEDGEFRVAGLPPGEYILSAGPSLGFSYSPYRPAMKLSSGYPRTWYPGGQRRSEATPISIAAGQHAEIEMSLQSVPAYLIKTHIVGVPPDSTPSLQILDSDGEDSSPLSQGFDPAKDEFYTVLPRGSFILKGSAETNVNGQQHTFSARLPLNVSGDMDDLVLALRPVPVIPISVRFESTQPGARYALPELRETPLLRLISTDAPQRVYYSQPVDPKDPNQVLRDIEPGKYWIEVLNINNGYVASMRCGTQNLKREMLTVTESQRVQPIELILRDDSGVLYLERPSDGAMLKPVQVLIVSDAFPETDTRFLPMMGGGATNQRGLAPGDYSIYIFDDVSQLEYRNPDALSAYSSRAVHVTLAPNAQSNVVLDPARTEQ